MLKVTVLPQEENNEKPTYFMHFSWPHLGAEKSISKIYSLLIRALKLWSLNYTSLTREITQQQALTSENFSSYED